MTELKFYHPILDKIPFLSNFVKYGIIKCGEIKSHPPDWRAAKRYLVLGCVCGDFACWKQASPVGERLCALCLIDVVR